jgi:hypothetical protein
VTFLSTENKDLESLGKLGCTKKNTRLREYGANYELDPHFGKIPNSGHSAMLSDTALIE